MLNLLSVGGVLQSISTKVEQPENHTKDYKAIKKGEPLYIIYKRFKIFDIKAKTEDDINKILISCHAKVSEEKNPAPEIVNYFDDRAETEQDGSLEITFSGGHIFGHRLIYYKKSYDGLPFFLTVRVLELDKKVKKLLEALEKNLGKISGLPLFFEFLPYIGAAKVGLKILAKISGILSKDDQLIEHELGLIFNEKNSPILQSGRYVCFPKIKIKKKLIKHLSSREISEGYELNNDNFLVKKGTEEEYNKDYFVIQIEAKPNSNFENFEYSQGTAEILKRVKASENDGGILDEITDLATQANNASSILRLEKLLGRENPEDKEELKTLFNGLEEDFQEMYKKKVEGKI